ncbi:hypothetical protein, partial [Streptomyces lavendulocolor]|uniref:hypothetical protein n=1 Tax=Streptomyces lavendulocolor TaxID=67316 RepID=UPI00340DB210
MCRWCGRIRYGPFRHRRPLVARPHRVAGAHRARFPLVTGAHRARFPLVTGAHRARLPRGAPGPLAARPRRLHPG